MSTSPFLTTTGRSRRPRRWRVLVAVAAALVVLALLGVGALWLLIGAKLPARTTIAGIAVGGLTESAARDRLEAAAAARVVRPVRLVAGNGERAGTSGRVLGAEPLVEEALSRAGEPGFAQRVLRRLGLGSAREVPLTYALGPVRVARLANDLDRRFGEPPRNGELVVREDTTTRVRPAAAGKGVDRALLRRALAGLPAEVELTFVPAEPVVSTEEAAAARARVDRLLAQHRIVRFEGVDATLWPRRLASLVRSAPEGGRLGVTLDAAALAAALRPRLGRFEEAARDAGFQPVGDRVRVTPSHRGVTLDGERIGASLLKNLDATAHLARFTVSEPALTTEQAKTLGIREKISEFTTYYPCCAPRVTNIHRGVEVMDGTIVLPGQKFSLNEVLGKRTVERGFVSAPQIFAGRLEDAIGGGVSQISTTTYNAAFFAGVQIITHQPHQFYISRYPMGREATVSWGGPEMIWRNDWPVAILVHAETTATSITVAFYSTKLGRRVETETGDPCCFVQPRTIVVRNRALPPGAKNVVQEAGPAGFTISYTRKVFRGDELRRNEHYTWRYDAENAVIEVGPPAKPKPKPKPAPRPAPGGPPAARPAQ